jgi:hypothetical protein
MRKGRYEHLRGALPFASRLTLPPDARLLLPLSAFCVSAYCLLPNSAQVPQELSIPRGFTWVNMPISGSGLAQPPSRSTLPTFDSPIPSLQNNFEAVASDPINPAVFAVTTEYVQTHLPSVAGN